jgi:Fur family ferric uptake transcriptional regulator
MTDAEDLLHTPVLPALDAWLAQAGLRRTRATLAVVQLFASDATWSATHAEVEQALHGKGLEVNRVTLYRLLDRLAQSGLLVRHADNPTRTWRFSLADGVLQAAQPGAAGGEGAAAVVPRFECDACHRQFRLTEASPPTQAVAEQLLQALASLGHQGQRVDLAVHGTCAGCAQPDAAAAASTT